ncbi:MAG TPA: N-acetylmuramoyl-L-alanine amidase [Tenuifilaceae bacterium]|nr:N-acetylmuramoyl-L-alanine amidase [Tenuifilaceae bacterium]HPI45135.1 N-acetylmuramoyl-L-alanine amidase [Tenuifilaceae bacterium]HPN21749.1 N-acetylmuramoyl-L-alanine amidase [Tenuifilaceae bacterium]
MKMPITITFFSKINAFLVLLLMFDSNLSFCQSSESYDIRKIVIDAGHGGKDPGTVGRISKEKDITLKIALKLGSYIEKSFPSIKIIYTRKDDTFIPLDERSKIANDAGADLFISIHCNATERNSPIGTETYVMGLHRSNDNLDVAMRENAVITYEDDYSTKYEGYDPNSSESFIIFSMLQNAHLDQSLNFANLIQTDFRERANRKDRGVRQAGFLVLWKTSMPSVLVEVGYLSHPKEELYLNSAEGQEHLSSSIFRAFKEYKRNIDERNEIAAKNQFNHTLQNSVSKEPAQINTSWENPKSTSSVSFKVQFLVSSKKLTPDSNHFSNLKDIYEIEANGVYKYCAGNTSSYNDILAYCQEIKKIYPDAFIIALKNGNPIPIDIAIKETTNNQVQ